MIKVTRINGSKLIINCEMIVFIEETPDTVITLSSGVKMIVQESIDELIDQIVSYKNAIGGRLPMLQEKSKKS